MLKRVTEKFKDKSTDRFFKFSFYCDRCGKEWTSDPYYFENAFSEKLTDGERRAKDIMWRVDHDAAFERANLEARLRFDRCNVCGKTVCDDCFAMEEDAELCLDCAGKRR